ncbi:MAG: hypothetical protein EOO43_11645, partial [Flavobacterium sp.]
MENQIIAGMKEHRSTVHNLVQLIAQKFTPLQIFCFNRKVSVTGNAGCFRDQVFSVNGDYNLLMITESNTRVDHEVQDYVNHVYQCGSIAVICHGKQAVSDAIEKQSTFFKMIFHSAELLYSADGMFQCESFLEARPERTLGTIEDRFQHRITLVEGFYNSAELCFTQGRYI